MDIFWVCLESVFHFNKQCLLLSIQLEFEKVVQRTKWSQTKRNEMLAAFHFFLLMGPTYRSGLSDAQTESISPTSSVPCRVI